MKHSLLHIFSICIILLVQVYSTQSRTIHRPPALVPQIETYWSNTPHGQHYTLTDNCLEAWAMFGRYDKTFLEKCRLPEQVMYRNKPGHSVSKKELEGLLEKLTAEILSNKHSSRLKLSHFSILKDHDFSYGKSSGLIILKCTKHPFVVKLYLETPETFVRPFSKGLIPAFFFVMGGGINRYLAGFTRIPNLHAINNIIKQNERWRNKISTPRKWYWTPANVKNFTVIGHNMGSQALSASLPSVYAIICDEIIKEREFELSRAEDRAMGIELVHLFGNRLDPHICNFIVEKDTGKITFIDTEHFGSLVGLREELHYESYTGWITQLIGKCFRNAMFKTTAERLREANNIPEILQV
ncbi:MAG: hypothetical protein JW725_04155 [Candidatus Babeliaceae bacterium]|nr:hypothetical protein [Candidatus Babeliaceae bacterium]